MLDDRDKQEARYARLTTAPIYPLLWRMAIPAMIGMVVNSLYSITDTFWIGRLNRTDWTASIGIAFSFISVIQAIGFWFGYGSGNYISCQLGKRQTQEAERMAATGLVLAVAAGMVILSLGMIFVRPLALLLGAGASKGLLDASVTYLRITMLGVPFMLFANVLYNQLRLQGNGRDAMIGLLSGMLLNMLLDPLLILPLQMGVSGAALASVIGQLCGCAVLWALSRRNGNIRIHFSKAKPDRVYLSKIFAGGAPNFCRQGISSLSLVLMNQVAGAYGDYAIASFSVTGRIIAMGYALVIGFGQGFQPICAINFGAGEHARIKTAFRYAWFTATGFLVLATAMILVFIEPLMMAFTKETDVLQLSVRILRAQCCVLPFMGYYILSGMLLQNIGRFGCATLVTIAENGIFLIPAVLILPYIFGLNGLVWVKPAADVCALILSLMIGMRAWKTNFQK